MEPTRSLPRIRPRPWRGIGTLGVLCALAALCIPGKLDAQVEASAVTSAAQDTTAAQAGGISPRGAFLRAVAIPGWGHASIGSYKRGAFYFAVEGATAWSLVKTSMLYHEVRDRANFREDFLRATLAEQGVTDPEEIQAFLDEDEALQDLRALEDSRRQQREDWTALGIFLLLLTGADAYVSAHLRDFPAPLEVNVQPVGNGRVELSVGVTLPR